MIQGLHHELATKLAEQEAAAMRLADPAIRPNEKHSLEWTAGDLDRSIAKLRERIDQDQVLSTSIGQLIGFMVESKHSSRLRSLAMTDLEQAQDRIRRELGDIPKSGNFTAEK